MHPSNYTYIATIISINNKNKHNRLTTDYDALSWYLNYDQHVGLSHYKIFTTHLQGQKISQ